MPENIYDNKSFFEDYINLRNDRDNLSVNELVEMPAIYAMFPDLKGKNVLDLGCGSGNNCMKSVELGASYVLGTDVSENMIKLAKETNNHPNIEYKKIAMEDISSINKTFDVVISSLAFHYVENYEKLIKDVFNLLNEDGILIFSQEHPLSTGTILNDECKSSSKIKLGNKEYKLLSDYNINGSRIVNWLGSNYTKYHRNFSFLINTLINAGFKIEKIVEPIASEENVKRNPKYKNQLNMPYFIIIMAGK